jgi:hypothetical protein
VFGDIPTRFIYIDTVPDIAVTEGCRYYFVQPVTDSGPNYNSLNIFPLIGRSEVKIKLKTYSLGQLNRIDGTEPTAKPVLYLAHSRNAGIYK